MQLTKRFKGLANFANWCNNYQLKPNDGAALLQLLQKRSALKVRECNGEKVNDADLLLLERACEDTAKRCGFVVEWDSHMGSLYQEGRLVAQPDFEG